MSAALAHVSVAFCLSHRHQKFTHHVGNSAFIKHSCPLLTVIVEPLLQHIHRIALFYPL